MKVKEFKDTIISRLSEYGIRPDIRNGGYGIHGDEENDEHMFILIQICIDDNVHHFIIDDTITQEQLEYEELLTDDLEICREYVPDFRWFCNIQDTIERIITNHVKIIS